MVNIVFVHPDLGIGGAERAVVDAAMSLKSCGHHVQFMTAHHDRNHCFEETKNGQLKVTVIGDWLPTSVFGRCKALFAYLRMVLVALYVSLFSRISYDLLIVDQVSACIPFLRLSRRKAKILFYCHYPDMLLTGRNSTLKSLYRAPLDWFEEITTGMADRVLVNSKFTAGVFKETFKRLSHIEPAVLYPIPNFALMDSASERPPSDDIIPQNKKFIFLSINRYERKKNLDLALHAFMHLEEEVLNHKDIHLIMAGGYDERVSENRHHYLELRQLASELRIENQVTFIRSFDSDQKFSLLTHATCLLYTPENEHFGIVPIEAMHMKLPVIAVASGGPTESVEHEKTGFLCAPEPEEFAAAMKKFVDNPELKKELGEAGYQRVNELFSFQAFTTKLDSIVNTLCASEK